MFILGPNTGSKEKYPDLEDQLYSNLLDERSTDLLLTSLGKNRKHEQSTKKQITTV